MTLLLRAAVCLLRLVVGLDFLATTYQVDDLILNACALEIIKKFQQELMETVASPDLRKKLEYTRIRLSYAKNALRWYAPETVRTTSTGSVLMRFRFAILRVLFISATLSWAYVFLLQAFVERVELAEATICGGDV